MTYQIPEQLTMLGQTMELYTTPLDALMAQPGRRLPFRTRRNTACSRGYIGLWEIDDDGRLFLVGFDPQHSSVESLTPIDADIGGSMAITTLPDGAPRGVSFGALATRPPAAMQVRENSARRRTWLRHPEAGLVVALAAEDVARWRDNDERLALETSTSYFALMRGRRQPTEPPIVWTAEDDGLLNFRDFEPITRAGETSLDRLDDVKVAHDPVGLIEPPWQSHHVSRIVDQHRRENLQSSSAYLPTGATPDRVDLRECRWWLTSGNHLPTTADVEPGANGPVHATWVDGELRVVPAEARRTQRQEIDGRYTKYSWDGSTFDSEMKVSIVQGTVAGRWPPN